MVWVVFRTLNSMGTKLGSSQAGEGAIVTNVRSVFRGMGRRMKEYSPQERAHGSTGSRNNVNGRKRRHFGLKKGVEIKMIVNIQR